MVDEEDDVDPVNYDLGDDVADDDGNGDGADVHDEKVLLLAMMTKIMLNIMMLRICPISKHAKLPEVLPPCPAHFKSVCTARKPKIYFGATCLVLFDAHLLNYRRGRERRSLRFEPNMNSAHR